MREKEIALKLRNLNITLSTPSKTTPLVSDFSLDIERGKITALVGESGAGKSLIAQAILRLLPQAFTVDGSILFEEENLLELSKSRMHRIRGGRISIVFQEPKNVFNPVFSIGSQLVEVVCHHLHLSPNEAIDRVEEVLCEVQLSEPKKIFASYPHELSGGMLQRALIAMALLSRPALLIADEPTTALDVTIQAQILALLDTLRKKGISIFLITHDLGVVAEIADFAAVIYRGRLVETASAVQLFERAQHPYTEALFKARHFQPKKERFTVKEREQEDISGCAFAPFCSYATQKCMRSIPELYSTHQNCEKRRVRCFLFEEPKI